MQDNIIEIETEEKADWFFGSITIAIIKIKYNGDVVEERFNPPIYDLREKIKNMLKYYFKNLYGDCRFVEVSVNTNSPPSNELTNYATVKTIRSSHRIDTFNQIIFKINDKRYKEDSMTNLKEAYKTMHNNCGIEVGDKVKIVRNAKDYELGWESDWHNKMDKSIGCWGTVIQDKGKFGFMVKFESMNNDYFLFPFFVLEIIEKAGSKKEKSNKTEVLKAKCKCGCELEILTSRNGEIVVERCWRCKQNNIRKGREQGKEEVGYAVKRSLGF